jgi:hypothetical protein
VLMILHRKVTARALGAADACLPLRARPLRDVGVGRGPWGPALTQHMQGSKVEAEEEA